MWLKYSDEPILTGEQWDRDQIQHEHPSEYDKPRGFWITDDSEDCWRSWCVGEGFNLGGLTHKHEVVIDERDILFVRGSAQIELFARQYAIDDRWGPPGEPRKWRRRCIDWRAVAERHSGIIITPYQYHYRLQDGFSWYYVWDCASGCIWKASAILDIRLIEIDHDVARPREAKAA